MSQLVEIEDYKCKFCNNRILSGYRCTDCYLKNIRTVPVIQDNPYKDLVPDDIHGISDLVINNPDPWIHTFTTSGASTNHTPGYPFIQDSPTMAFDIGKNTCDRQNKVQGTRSPTGYLTNEDVRGWRSSRI